MLSSSMGRHSSLILRLDKYSNFGVPIVAQWKQTRLVSMRRRVLSLVPPSGLKIWHCFELLCILQMQLGSGIAVAVV